MKKMRKMMRIGAAVLVALAMLACEARTDGTDHGGVLLDVAWAASGGGIPFRVSVNGNDSLMIPTIRISSIAADPNGATSSLMDVELETMEVVFRRSDAGSQVPAPYVVSVLGTVPIGGILTLNNWDVMSFEQFRNPPLSDLRFENGGLDKETGLDVIRLELITRVFGRTRSGRSVQSVPRAQTIEFGQ